MDASGEVKSALKVRPVKGGRCTDIGYTYVGGIAYRCGAGNRLYNACWRDGPNPTELVICVGTPWDTTVTRLHSPRLLLYPGVTHELPAPVPWAIELGNGKRCTLFQGAHDSVRTPGKVFAIDYYCERSDLVLLREGQHQGRVWHINGARWNPSSKRYTFIGDLPIRRVYFGTLPRPMKRQHRVAHDAVAFANRIVRRSSRDTRFLVWARLALPRPNWAYVIFKGLGGERGWFVLLRRVDDAWQDASAQKPYCSKLPKAVRRQLFLPKGVRPGDTLAPRGEQHC